MQQPQKQVLRPEEITADFLQLMEKHISDLLHRKAEHRFHTSDFAGRLFIHPRHLTNTIKQTTGKSPCDFMEERIVEEAQKMLKDTTLSIADIGASFAWDDPTNFTKFFKGMTGQTPLQYRKSVKG